MYKKSGYLCFLLAFVLAFSSVVFFVPSAPAAAYYAGDIDSDGSISSADARLALRCSVGLERLSSTQYGIADLDGDAVVSSADARLILRTSVGLESKISLSSSFTYSNGMFSVTLPSYWRGRYKIDSTGNSVTFRQKNGGGKLFDLTFVKSSDDFVYGITSVHTAVGGKANGYIISYAVTDAQFTPSTQSEYMKMSEYIPSIIHSMTLCSGYTRKTDYSFYEGCFGSGNMINGPAYTVDILSVNGSRIKFAVTRVGYNLSPIYSTPEYTVTLSGGRATFSWEDSWYNRGTGVIELKNGYVVINMKETYTASFNRSTLDTDGDLLLGRV